MVTAAAGKVRLALFCSRKADPRLMGTDEKEADFIAIRKILTVWQHLRTECSARGGSECVLSSEISEIWELRLATVHGHLVMGLQ